MSDEIEELPELLTEAFSDVDTDDAGEAAATEALEAWYDDEDLEQTAEAWEEDLHPRAAAGSTGGGQFTSGGGGGSASSSSKTASKTPSKTPGHAKASGKRKRIGGAALAFDAKSGRGPGYGVKGGDKRVHKLQQALNRLGLTDSRGRKLVDDGKLGPRTTEAIKAAQRRMGLKADGKVTPQLLAKLVAAKSLPAKKAAPKAPAAKMPAKTPMKSKAHEAIDGQRSAGDTREILGRAVGEWAKEQSDSPYAWAYVCDFTDALVVFEWDSKTWQAPYTLTESGTTGTAELGDPTEVVAQTWYVPAAGGDPTMPADDGDPEDMLDGGADEMTESVEIDTTEAVERIPGRVIEGKGTDAAGNRIFSVRIISAGDSLNGRRYPASVLEAAVPLYEGAKAYDHHRTVEELRSSTISGLVGYYRNVQATAEGLDGDLVLLPSATHTAEALDATVAAQDEGLPPLVGISHDAMTVMRPITVGGRRLQEATRITKVNSADVVADPAAGGKATRVLAGGIETDESKESDVVTTTDVLAVLKTATADELAAVGLQRSSEAAPTKPEPEPQGLEKASFLGSLMIKEKVTAAGLPTAVAESLTGELPDRFTESEVDARIAGLKAAMGLIERAELHPTVTATVTKEALDKKVAALDKFFAQDFSGYRSFKEAFIDITGRSPRSAFDEDFNRVIMRESIGDYYDSGDRRSTESLSSSSWNLVLGDSITRRLVDEYNQPDLQNWRQIASSIVPVNDFRTQRIDRIGGYGTLPAVNQGAPYQPLTSPSNEEITYAVTKRGGTEDVTLEMIANDDVRAISRIPRKLGLAAANTLYQFVWNFITTNAGTATNSGATIYDSAALFSSGHANYVNGGSGSALSQSALSAGRLLMRSQTAYGDTAQFIAPTPRFLIVVNDIEELAWQLVTSSVALPTAANTPPQSTGAANTPNLHQGLGLIVLDYIPNGTSTTAWWLAADPGRIPTLEIGFYQGQQDPALFTQSDPTVGSVFNADKVTYKIRHIYSGAVLDYRGFVKGNV